MPLISAVIITWNEEKFIGQCLESLKGIADEIIILDSFSDDSTEQICRKYNARFEKHAFEGYIEQKNFAAGLASNNWILSLDADEALSDELKKSISAIRDNPGMDGYFVNRRNNYCGRWLRFSGWYPDRHLRFFNSQKGSWAGLNPHDKFILEKGCRTGKLKGDLLHLFYSSAEEHLEKMDRFSSIAASSYNKAGMTAGKLTPLIHGTWSFIRSYFLRGGFLDGREGFDMCRISARGSYLKYRKLRQLQTDNKGIK
ncbi:MAG TPA: glycosyltransferase family 2 protein [Bacteroidales bacterium]|nr:glycosyltransferase family 2 protein [Bacteroidales bacterium]